MRNLTEKPPDNNNKNETNETKITKIKQVKKVKQTKPENILGLAKKAGAITSGTELVIDSVRKKRACHIFVCSDASPGTLKKISDKASYYQVPLTKLDITMSELSHCVGLSRLTAAVSLTNKNFLNLFDLTENEKSTEVHL